MSIENTKTGIFRWRVTYVDGDGSDDWQLYRNSWDKFFDTEDEAKAFAETKMFKKKPIYWQPDITKQEKIIMVETSEVWEYVKQAPHSLKY